MAHAGTPSDLAKQPAASSSTWKSMLSLVVILAIGIGMIIAVPFITGGRATTAPAVDRSYDQIENARGATTLSGVAVDTNAVQKAAAAKARAMSGVAADNSLDAAVRGASGATVDTSYTSVENLRAQSGVTVDTSYKAGGTAAQSARQFDPMVPVDSTSFDRKYQELQIRAGHGPLH